MKREKKIYHLDPICNNSLQKFHSREDFEDDEVELYIRYMRV